MVSIEQIECCTLPKGALSFLCHFPPRLLICVYVHNRIRGNYSELHIWTVYVTAWYVCLWCKI